MQRAERILVRINELASISEDEACLTRTYGTPAFLQARDLVKQWMNQAGLKTWVDQIGNIRGRLESRSNSAKTLVIASHIDTVLNAGKFDGPLGVIMGLDLLEQLIHDGATLPFHVELIGFCDEEGCRFHSTYLGSKAVTGSLEPAVLHVKDAAGIALSDVIAANGGDVNKLSKDAIAGQEWLGYFEIHIEQGPILYERKIPVGWVTAIAGQRRARVSFTGEAGHAGTVPMTMRKDALCCAAEFIAEVERFARNENSDLVATVGKLDIANAASNVIPGEVSCSLDLRSADEAKLLAAYEELHQKTELICKQRGIGLEWKPVHESSPVFCDTHLSRLTEKAISQSGYLPVALVSGAGHDAVPVSRIAPVAMLFVRCFKGISHNPLEDVEAGDIEAAAMVAQTFLELLIKNESQ